MSGVMVAQKLRKKNGWVQSTILGLIVGLFICFSGSAYADEIEPSQDITSTQTQESVISQLERDFSEKHLKLGSPIFLRIYKQSSEVELWVQHGLRYQLFRTYTICRWSGFVGPKFTEGDRQSPEGLYYIKDDGLIVNPRWHRALRLNYPNAFDKANGRTGSGILIHGKCSSVGCFALQDQNIEQVYDIVQAAFQGGQLRIPVLSLPFRFATALREHFPASDQSEFWNTLRHADTMFNRDGIPPSAWLCQGQYRFLDRRGGHLRHLSKLEQCQPLNHPMAASNYQKQLAAAKALNSTRTTKDKITQSSQGCDLRETHCRLLRVALASKVPCPIKYARCRTLQSSMTKSVDCPLKYPRCRFFIGPEPKHVSFKSTEHLHKK